MSDPTFAECFCAKYNLSRDQYARAVLRRALYRRAYLIRWLFPLIERNYYAADFDLIYSVEGLRRLRDFNTESKRFSAHPANRGWLRRTFCLRVSTSRLKRIIRETLPAREKRAECRECEDNGSAVPFEVNTEHRTLVAVRD